MAISKVLNALVDGAKRGKKAAPTTSGRAGQAAEKSANAVGRMLNAVKDFAKGPGEALGLEGAPAVALGLGVWVAIWKYILPML